jgi:hypothetical protein
MRQLISWQAMAILTGMPNATEKELYEYYGCGRASRGLQDTGGDFGNNVVVLCMEKEEFPCKCYVSWNGF